jgi:tetratricopeptide (TPR) repeat protein
MSSYATSHNANVFYELGIRHALRKKRTVLIKGKPTADATPFDVLTDRYVTYDASAPANALDSLTDTIKAALVSERDTDSPVFKMLPGLPEADLATLQVVPLALREDADRALVAQSKGWLRLLAHEVRGKRFEAPALLMIAEALWNLKDYEAARDAYERIRETASLDPAANLALANIYERLYKVKRAPELLTSSDQAIKRVVGNKSAVQKDRIEALALRGRNAKTRWREQFASIKDLGKRRTAAMNDLLRQSYAGYADAFREDLNHFWSGLAALQMGVMFLDLTKDDGWTASFDTDTDASKYRQALDAEVAALKVVVRSSIEAGLRRLPPNDPNRAWATISRADLLFLTEDAPARVVRRYLDSIPPDKPFAWDAARGQLELFESLGVRAALARPVIDAVNERMKAPAPPPGGKPLHIVMFAGHQFDEPGRLAMRFPAVLERSAYRAVLEFLRGLQQTDEVIGLASGSVGADILFHEACRELQMKSTICLPIPTDAYVDFVARDLAWRSRLLALIQQKRAEQPPAILELNTAPGVPPWLQGSGTNEWERGNRWVLDMAVTADASKVTLLVVWDEQEKGDSPSGTAHLVSLARRCANVDIKVITTTQLHAATVGAGS